MTDQSMSAQHTPGPVMVEGRSFIVVACKNGSKSVVEMTGPDSRKPVNGALRQKVLAAYAGAIAKAAGSAS